MVTPRSGFTMLRHVTDTLPEKASPSPGHPAPEPMNRFEDWVPW